MFEGAMKVVNNPQTDARLRGVRQNSSFPLFPWCRRSVCTLSITMKLLDIPLGLIINFHESSCA
jgi:hypothetical protein